jgi:hypothetical protein
MQNSRMAPLSVAMPAVHKWPSTWSRSGRPLPSPWSASKKLTALKRLCENKRKRRGSRSTSSRSSSIQSRQHGKDNDADRIHEIKRDRRRHAQGWRQNIAERRPIHHRPHGGQPHRVDRSEHDQHGDIGNHIGHRSLSPRLFKDAGAATLGGRSWITADGEIVRNIGCGGQFFGAVQATDCDHKGYCSGYRMSCRSK